MEDFLRKIKLIVDMSTTFKMTRTEFVSVLRDDVEESDITGIFSGMFEFFSSNKKKYKGLVDSRGFHIRHKSGFFKKKRTSINAKGTFRSNGEDLIVNTKISAFIGSQLLAMSFIFVGYFIFIFYQFDFINSFQKASEEIPLFFILFFAAIPIGFYFSLRKEVANMKKDLNEQFYSIATKINHSR